MKSCHAVRWMVITLGACWLTYLGDASGSGSKDINADPIEIAESDYIQIKSRVECIMHKIVDSISSNSEKDRIKKSQSDWMKFIYEDAKIRADLTSGGGSAYAIDYLSNLREHYQKRELDLKRVLHSVSRE